MEVIGVRFKSTKKIYYFAPNGLDIKKDDNVIVETSRGIEFGQTVIGIRDVPEKDIVQPLQKVIRIATPEDVRTVEYNAQRQKDAFDKCLKKIEQHQLDMKLVDAEYTFDGTKLIFYFTSDGRVDFRDLVKDLATMFRTRIELRQIAVRDETKMLGGLGACGNEICCKKFLGDFASVSIKMAKEQNLSLNPTKISGLCGRLICCLNYEKDFYDEMNEKLPSQDEAVMTPKGQATVIATYPLKESVRVKYTNPDGSTDTTTFHINDITRINPSQIAKQVSEEGDDADFIPDQSDEGVTVNARSKARPHGNKPYQKRDTQGDDAQAGNDDKPYKRKPYDKDKSYNKDKPYIKEKREYAPEQSVEASAVSNTQQDEQRQQKPKPPKYDKKPRGDKPQSENNRPEGEGGERPYKKHGKPTPKAEGHTLEEHSRDEKYHKRNNNFKHNRSKQGDDSLSSKSTEE